MSAMKETADLVEDAPADAPAPQKHLHPAWFGLLIIPFGIVTGYCGVTLPRVFEQAGETTTAVAAFQAFAMQPHSFKFVIEPALDARWRKRSWFVWSIVLTAILLPVAVLLQSMRDVHIGRFGQLTLMAGILFAANAAVATSSGAMHALMATTLPTEKKGSAGGWAMAGNLGGYGVGGAIGLFLTQKLPPVLAAISMAALVVAVSAPALMVKEKAPPAHPIFKAVGNLLKDAWKTMKSTDGWTGFVICLSPIGCGGVAGLFSDMASKYGAGDNQVALVNGLFGGIVSAVGCIAGGYVADKMNRRLAYGLAGALTGVVAIVMSMLPMTPNVYTIGCLAYSFALGIAYAAWAAFVLDLMGHGAGVATKHALLAAAGNQATNYMLVVCGLAADRHVLGGMLGEGPRAALRADALGTVVGLAILLVMLVIVSRHKRAVALAAEQSPAM
jgi:PAT family beta-lactamase induction signal transducer AmpG